MTFAARVLWEAGTSGGGEPPPPPPAVNLIDANLASLTTSPYPASFTYSVNNTGNVVAAAFTGSQNYDWLNTGTASDYEVRWVPALGSQNPETGAVNTWLSLGTSRSWGATLSAEFGQEFYYGTVEIREIGTTAILASADITVSLIVTSDEFILE